MEVTWTTREVEVPKTARVVALRPEVPVGRIWALHGYGQLPQFFLKRFQQAAEAGWEVIAPEGLHRFYLEGTAGRVGASWMTKEAREADMADYVRYLDAVHAGEPALAGPTVLLGFSQGVATAARWACRGVAAFDAHVFWAGVFPPDLDMEAEVAPLRRVPTWVALGDADPFFKEDLLTGTSERFAAAGIDHDLVRFTGAHHIDADALGQILSQLR